MIGQTLARQLHISPGQIVEIGEHKATAAAILDSGTEFDTYIIVNGPVENPTMILIRSRDPGQYRGQDAVILQEMVRSKYSFLESIRKLMWTIAIVASLASMTTIINLARMDAANRQREFGVLKSLGARKAVLRRLLGSELSILAAITSLLGVLLSGSLAAGVLFYAAKATPKIDVTAIGTVVLTSCAAFAVAALIYFVESGKQNAIREIQGE